MIHVLKRLFDPKDSGYTLAKDDIPWEIRPRPERIVAIGDVHGDLAGLACILRSRGLISKKGRWRGGDTQLVLNGDLVGGKNARVLLHFILRLSQEATDEGGRIDALLGNHDVRVFSKKYQKRLGKTLFQQLPVTGAWGESPKAAFEGDTAYARFLRERNALLKIGSNVFAHGGLNAWAFRHHPRRINATIRAWIRFWQGVDVEPNPRTEWVALGPNVDFETDSDGPLWTTSFKANKQNQAEKESRDGSLDSGELSKLLRKYKAERLILGHAPTPSSEILLFHPYYGEKVVMIDTRLSDRKKGRLSCLEITAEGLEGHYPKRTSFGEEMQEREVARIRKRKKKAQG